MSEGGSRGWPSTTERGGARTDRPMDGRSATQMQQMSVSSVSGHSGLLTEILVEREGLSRLVQAAGGACDAVENRERSDASEESPVDIPSTSTKHIKPAPRIHRLHQTLP